MKMRRTLFESGRYEEMSNDDRLIHVPLENTSQYVELFANNNTSERRLLELTIGGYTANVRIENVTSLPSYGDVLRDDHGDVGVVISVPRRSDVYGSAAITTNGGTLVLPPSVQVGDVICVYVSGVPYHAVVTRSGDNGVTQPALPDGEYDDWLFFTRMNDSNYRKGPGTIVILNEIASCSCRHSVIVGDRVVADLGGRPCLMRVEEVLDEMRFKVSGSNACPTLDWWHLPSTQEVLISLTSKDECIQRLTPGVRISRGERDAFGQASTEESCGTLYCAPLLQTPQQQNVLSVTLRPNCQRTCILPNVCLGLNNHGILSCRADKDGVTVGGYICTPTETINWMIR